MDVVNRLREVTFEVIQVAPAFYVANCRTAMRVLRISDLQLRRFGEYVSKPTPSHNTSIPEFLNGTDCSMCCYINHQSERKYTGEG